MIVNASKKRVLAKNFGVCNSSLSKAKGLMFSGKKTLVFIFGEERRISIHMFFVFFPIDILFLDKNRRVIEIKRELKPFEVYRSRKCAKYFIEFPLGVVNKGNTALGDKIEW